MPDRRSPLGDQPPVTGLQVAMSEVAHTGKLDLRGDAADRAFLAAVGGVLGLVLPTEPNTVTTEHAVTALWAGPDEWLLVTRPGDEAAVAGRIKDAIAGYDATLVDLTDARTVIRLGGPKARDLIAKGCPLDLHPRAFHSGQVAQSVLAGITVMLHQTADDGEAGGPAYDLYVASSFAASLWQWLADAAVEFDTGPMTARHHDEAAGAAMR